MHHPIQTLLRLAAVLVACVTIGAACGAPPVRPAVPANTFVVEPLTYKAPAADGSSLWTYAPAADMANPLTADGVTVSVMPIVAESRDVAEFADVIVECTTPDRRRFFTSIVGFAVRLSITNDTGHIITTERSALQIEDGEGNSWDLIDGNWVDWIPLMTESIHERYNGHRLQVSNWRTSELARLSGHPWLPPTYTAQWEQYLSEYQRCAGGFSISGLGGADTDVRCGSARQVNSISPNVLSSGFQQVANSEVQAASARAGGQIAEHEMRCFDLVNENALRPDLELMTEDRFEHMRIMPGETVTSYLPLDPDFGAWGPDEVSLRLYDLVTDTDAAGNPTRRTNFHFTLVRTEVPQ